MDNINIRKISNEISLTSCTFYIKISSNKIIDGKKPSKDK